MPKSSGWKNAARNWKQMSPISSAAGTAKNIGITAIILSRRIVFVIDTNRTA